MNARASAAVEVLCAFGMVAFLVGVPLAIFMLGTAR